MESPAPPPSPPSPPSQPPPTSQPKKLHLSSSKDRSKRSRKKRGEMRTRRSDAKDFVHEVRSVLRDDGVKYMRFLNIMRCYRLKSIGIDDVKWFVEKLFEGRMELIKRMNDFLPMEHKIDLPLQSSLSLKKGLKIGMDIDSRTHKSRHGKDDGTILRKYCRYHVVNRGDLVKCVDRKIDLEKVTSEEKGDGGFRKMDGKDGDCVGASGDSSGHNSSDGVKYLNKSISYIDFSGCQRCSPSYYHLPENRLLPPATCATEDDASVLNDRWVSVPSCGSVPFKHRHKNQYEEQMLKCEDERYELDMLFQVVKTTIEAMENLHEDLPDSSANIYPIPLKDYFSDLSLRCIERLYDDHGLEAIENLQCNPYKAVPTILNSLKRKRDEFISVDVLYKRNLCEFFANNYRKFSC